MSPIPPNFHSRNGATEVKAQERNRHILQQEVFPAFVFRWLVLPPLSYKQPPRFSVPFPPYKHEPYRGGGGRTPGGGGRTRFPLQCLIHAQEYPGGGGRTPGAGGYGARLWPRNTIVR